MTASTPSERRAVLSRAVHACEVAYDRPGQTAWSACADAFRVLADAEDCEQVENDRDDLSATIERLYDGIDAAIDKLPAEGIEYAWREIWDARRILQNLRAGGTTEPEPDAPTVTRCRNCDQPIIARDRTLGRLWVHQNTGQSHCSHHAEPRTP